MQQTHEHARRQYTIPVFPHVKKFINKTYPTAADCVLVDECTDLGKFITLALIDNRAWKESRDLNTPERAAKFTESIKVMLTIQQAEMRVRQSKLIRLNIDMDRVFKAHLITFIESKKQDGYPVRLACRKFMEYFNLDESEYSLDAAYKHYQRAVLKKD
jgi:hypothetical protein